jgi:hypothetical protein
MPPKKAAAKSPARKAAKRVAKSPAKKAVKAKSPVRKALTKDEQIEKAAKDSIDSMLRSLTREAQIVPGVKSTYADWNREAIYKFALPLAKTMIGHSAKEFFDKNRDNILEWDGDMGPEVFAVFENPIIDEIYQDEKKIPYDSLADYAEERRKPFINLLTKWAREEKLINNRQTVYDLVEEMMSGEYSDE